MTAQSPPTPPAVRERRPERVDLVAATASFLISSLGGREGIEVEDEVEGMATVRSGEDTR